MAIRKQSEQGFFSLDIFFFHSFIPLTFREIPEALSFFKKKKKEKKVKRNALKLKNMCSHIYFLQHVSLVMTYLT
jgi:hypothetical protein